MYDECDSDTAHLDTGVSARRKRNSFTELHAASENGAEELKELTSAVMGFMSYISSTGDQNMVSSTSKLMLNLHMISSARV